MNNSSAILNHLSSTVNDPDESSNHNDNYEIPSSLKSDCSDNNDYTSTIVHCLLMEIPPVDEQIYDYRIRCHNKYIVDLELNSTNNKSIGTELNDMLILY